MLRKRPRFPRPMGLYARHPPLRMTLRRRPPVSKVEAGECYCAREVERDVLLLLLRGAEAAAGERGSVAAGCSVCVSTGSGKGNWQTAATVLRCQHEIRVNLTGGGATYATGSGWQGTGRRGRAGCRWCPRGATPATCADCPGRTISVVMKGHPIDGSPSVYCGVGTGQNSGVILFSTDRFDRFSTWPSLSASHLRCWARMRLMAERIASYSGIVTSGVGRSTSCASRWRSVSPYRARRRLTSAAISVVPLCMGRPGFCRITRCWRR